MAFVQPALCVVSYVGVTLFGILLDGWRSSVRRLLWQVSVVALIAAFNCVFYQRGSTLLFEAGPLQLRLESLAFGLCMGLALVTAMQVFTLLGEVVQGDDALSLFGGSFPTCALMTSTALGLVPRLQADAREIGDVEKACTSAGALASACGEEKECRAGLLTGLASKVRARSRVVTTLMSNAMEDSLVKADSMRARGWGCGAKKTSYSRRGMASSDWALLAAVAAVAIFALVSAGISASEFAFYPSISFGVGWAPYAACVAYALFYMLPSLACARRRRRWRR